MAKKQTEELDYHAQQSQNESVFNEMLRKIRPDLWVISDILNETGINYLVLLKVIRQLSNLSLGTGYGTVTVSVENGTVTFVRGEDSDKVNEKLIKPRQ